MEMGDDQLVLAAEKPKKRAGRRVFKETRHPVFRGVRRRNTDKWVCEVREPKHQRRIWLGTYPTPEMAARAHDVAALALRGRSACLNFADSASMFKPPDSLDAEDIRRAAAEAAEMFRPESSCETVLNNGGDHSQEENYNGGGDNGNNANEKEMTFVDEEEVFDMPAIMMSMAEGMLLSPPPLANTGSEMVWWDDEVGAVDMSLWNHTL